jgi:DNA modification methylase
MENLFTILQGDCVERLQEIPDGSVQLGVTSPPYDNLRTYGGFTWDFEKTALQLYRVLCDGGILCWNVGDSVVNGSETLTSAKQKIFFREEAGFRIHDTMFYEKANPANPSDAQGRYNQCVEYIFVLSKGRPRAFNPIKDKPNVSFGEIRYGRKARRNTHGEINRGYFSDRTPAAEFGLRGNCWRGKTSAQESVCKAKDHPAMMPKWLAHDLILSWSNIGDTVIDPLAGSGTTGKEALELGRKAILIELNPAYIDIINQQCNVTPGLALA